MKYRSRWLMTAVAAFVLVAAACVLWDFPGHNALALGNTIYVDGDATGNNDGTSWEDAYTTLQPALEDAADGDEIWVAAGTYMPTYEFSPGDPRSATFQMKNGVALYGGFDPTVGDVGWEDRDWANNVAILSGDIGVPGDPADNSYHVFYHPAELALDGSAVLDGFTISDGNANLDSWPNRAGGGMYNNSSSPTVTNCTFSGNSADSGGGMFNEAASPMVTECIFSGNSATGDYGRGGGMWNYSSSPTLTNCTFLGNLAEYGGGMNNYNGSSPAVTNCTFSDNSAGYGGGMCNEGGFSSPQVTNCTFSGNSADYTGGGMFNDFYSTAAVTNCVLWGDSPDEISNNGGEPVVTYSDIQGGYLGEGNIETDPLFTGPGSGDYHVGPGSPCIDAGTNDALYLPGHDFEGDPRAMDGDGDGVAVVDIGIDEVWGIDVICVDQDAAGDSNGTSWEDAYTDLQDALEDAIDSDEIWVAEGNYTPTYSFDPEDLRSATFQLKNGVALYGGFDPSVGDVGWEDRDWVNNVTILSGDIGTLGDPTDNSYHVFYHPAELALDATAVLDGFTVTGGNADDADSPNCDGGGMYNESGSPTVTNCTFSDNWASYSGAGMFNASSSSPAVLNCTFSENSAEHSGGGMCNQSHSSPVVTNCTFSGNWAGSWGGGMYNGISSPVMTNCTFSGNSAGYAGGGMFGGPYSSTEVTNSILWGDSPHEIVGSAIVTYSDIQGGYEGMGNIDADPLFVDPGSGDYHIRLGSPCIDAGTNGAPNLPAFDFEGDRRVMEGNGDWTALADMGIDEVLGMPPDFIYVDQDAAGYDTGTSWEDALTDLQDALAWAVEGDQIWVAEGTYVPTYLFSPGDPRSATFQLRNGVALYGGFDPSVGNTEWEDRDWVNNETILSGDIGIAGYPEDNVHHVFYHPAELALDGSAVLNGFTVSGGNADADPPNTAGGGMHNAGSSPTVANCAFLGNSAIAGGGMFNGWSSSPTVTDCTFFGNSADWGGGMYNSNSSSVVTNCTLSGNSAHYGGGMVNWSSSPVVANCTFSGNSVTSGGGGILDRESSSLVDNCTFSDNSAGWGGGICNELSSLAVTNSILWGDNSPYEITPGTNVTFSNIQGGYDGEGNINEDPLFVDPGGGDYHLGPGSPCIDAGANDAPNLPPTDFEGDPRVVDGNGDGMAVVDMGVDEVFGGHAVYLPIIFRAH